VVTIKRKILLLSVLAASAAGCNGSVNLDVTDASVDKAANVFVQFSGVSFQPSGAAAVSVTFNPPLTIDLLALKDGNTAALVSSKKMRDGNYDSLTLSVNASTDASDSYVILKDDSAKTKRPLSSIASDGLTLNGGFSLSKDKTKNLVIDFDLRKSVRDPLTGSTIYRLRPTLRLVDADNSGSIGGTVTGTGDCAVYVYQGSDATLGDEGSTTPPLSSALVRDDHSYRAGFLPPGDYTVAATCNADKDSADTSGDAVNLQGQTNVSVQAGVVTTKDFSL
jgi:hypothetical protein